MWETIFEKDNLIKAVKRVERNHGAAGSDGMSTQQLRGYLKTHWIQLRKDLDEGSYQPVPVRRKEIPKPHGGTRNLGIPTVVDRFLQQAITQALTPLFEPQFSDSSYGYRPYRYAHLAVKAAQGYIQDGYEYAVEIDLEKFFDRVNHDKLMTRVARKVKDKRVLRLIRKYLNCGAMINGVVVETVEGTPQGGPLSPLLANIMLDDLDHELQKRGHSFVRYADDIVIFVKSPRSGERVLGSVKGYISNELKLKVNDGKSAVKYFKESSILGFSFYQRSNEIKIRVTKGALLKCKSRLRTITKRTRGGTMKQILQEVNTYTKGWGGYYHLAYTRTVYQNLDGWIRRRLRQILWKRWKHYQTRKRELRSLGVSKLEACLGAMGDSPWKMSESIAMKVALNNGYWQNQGFESILTRISSLQKV